MFHNKDIKRDEINRLDEEDDLEAELGPKKSTEEAVTAVRNSVRADDRLEELFRKKDCP